MDLDIHRIDFIQLRPMGRNTLCVLPLAKKKQQKVAVGDDSGVVTVFYMKKGETQVEWTSNNLGREVTKCVLQYGKDKIFVACGQSILGFTRKGKEFLRIKTNLTETIQQMFANDTTIWTGAVVKREVCFLDLLCPKSGFSRRFSSTQRTGQKVRHMASKEGPDFGSSTILVLPCLK